MIRAPQSEQTARRCVVEGENHSTDLVTVFHGHTEPATACGFHAAYCPQLVFLAHNEAMRRRDAGQKSMSGIDIIGVRADDGGEQRG